MKKRKILKRGLASLLAAVLAVGLLPMMPGNMATVKAADGDKTIAGLGTVFFARPFWKKMQNFLENSASPNWRKLQRYRSVIFYRPGTSAGIVNCYKV